MSKRYPSQRQTYTLREILKELSLRDTPWLGIPAPTHSVGGVAMACEAPVQGDGWGSDEFLEKFGDLKFTYIRETDEWIPIFRFAGTVEEAKEYFDYAVMLTDFFDDGIVPWHVTFKGYPEDQDYTLSECGTQLCCSYDDPKPVPVEVQIMLDHLKGGAV